MAALEGPDLVLERPQLVLAGGKLCLSGPRTFPGQPALDGKGFVDGVRVGDAVSVHWSWACDVLSASALGRLQAATVPYLALANLTV